MKYRKNIAGFEKSKSLNYSTSVTATKGEKIVLFLSVLVYFSMIFISIFVLKNIFISIIIFVVGIFALMGLMVFFIFRPLHMEERMENERLAKITVDRSYNNITGEFKDNSKIEEIGK